MNIIFFFTRYNFRIKNTHPSGTVYDSIPIADMFVILNKKMKYSFIVRLFYIPNINKTVRKNFLKQN